ncbi:MAG: AI-2E family transporter [Candidatus Competibacter denitrificans]
MDIITNRLLRQAVPLFSVMATVALVLGVAAILMVGKDVIVPLALGALLSFALTPVVVWLERVGLPRGVAVLSAILVALALILGIAFVAYQQASVLAKDIPSYEPTIRQKISGLSQKMTGSSVWSDAADSLARVLTEIEKIGSDEAKAAAPAVPMVRIDNKQQGLDVITQTLQTALQPLASLLIVLLLSAFMLAAREDLRNRVIRLAGAEDIQQTTAAFDDAGFRVGRQLLTQLAVNMSLGLIIGTGLWIIGLPSPYLWGIIYGLLNFVPYLGLVGLIPPLFVAFATDPGWGSFLWTAGLFAIVEPVSTNIVEPMLYGRTSGLSPVAIIIAATVWAFLWGPIGLVLSTPLTICLVVLGRHIPRLQFLDILLGDRPALQPHEIFYQRMLASDPREAEMQARQFLKGRGISTYYDEIALEALRRAHLDIVRGSVTGDRLSALAASAEALVDGLDDVKLLTRRPDRQITAETEAALDTIRADREIEKMVFSRDDLREAWRGEYPVAILHGAHPLDGAAAKMLKQVLTKHGLAAQVLPLTEAAETPPEQAKTVALVCLSFIEPLSTLHLRAFSRQVKRRAPQAQVMLCIWQKTDEAIIREWRRKLRVDRLVTTTVDALDAAAAMASAKPISSNR